MLISALISLVLLHFGSVQAVTVTTLNGDVDGSTVNSGGSTINVFKGIPYANPPVCEFRFEKPEPVDDWAPAVLDTTSFKPSCLQPLPVPPNQPYRDPPTIVNEDCLFLNIWAPNGLTDAAVLVFFHGGGFFRGGAGQEIPEGSLIAGREKVLFITVSYRLGPLGFAYLGEDTLPGNLGLLDQQLALMWIRDNIKYFGGDPGLVTIVGHEAGAASVGIHLLAPSSADLFKYAILLSGSPTADWATNTAKDSRQNTKKLAELLDCPVNEDVDTLKCLKEVSVDSVIDNQLFVEGKRFPFAPVVDGTFLPDDPETMMEGGLFKNTSVLHGVVLDEATVYLLPLIWEQLGTTDPSGLTEAEYNELLDTILTNRKEEVSSKFLSQFYVDGELVPGTPVDYLTALTLSWSDLDYKCPTTDFAAYYSPNNPVYQYSFRLRLSTNPLPEWCGVASGYQLEVFLGAKNSVINSLTGFEKGMVKNMLRYMGNFAKSGSPNDPSPVSYPWPQYTVDEQYLVIDSTGRSTEEGLRNSQCNFINEILPFTDDSGVGAVVPSLILMTGVLVKIVL